MAYLLRKLVDALPAVLAALLLALLSLARPAWLAPSAWTHEGVCRELLAGTTEGRQALVGSLWHAPLPTLAGLPAAALLPRHAAPLAARVTAAAALAWLLLVLLRFARRRLPPVAAVMAWLGFLALPATGMLTGDPQLSVTLAAAIATLVKIADWRESRGLTDLIKFAFALALLGLCGGALGGWSLLLALSLPFIALFDRDLRPRFQGLLVLGALPLFYGLAVWALMSRLILFDSLYAWRFLRHGLQSWQGWEAARLPAVGALAATACALVGLVGLLWKRHAAAALGALGVALAGWHILLQAGGLTWAADAAASALRMTALLTIIAMAPTRPGPVRHAWGLLPLLLALALHAWSAPAPARQTAEVQRAAAQRDVLDAVASYVEARTPYGRVFVCGYRGLALLEGRERRLFVPSLDLHIDVLRRGYRRQNLFLLVPRPEADATLECAVWRYGDIYAHGAPRALFAGDWGDWRLYEIVTAPTADELDEWRQSAFK
jgi:hypothetical protein